MGAERPQGVSFISKQVACQVEEAPYQEGAYLIVKVDLNLEALTRGIPEYALIDEVSLRYQRQLKGLLPDCVGCWAESLGLFHAIMSTMWANSQL